MECWLPRSPESCNVDTTTEQFRRAALQWSCKHGDKPMPFGFPVENPTPFVPVTLPRTPLNRRHMLGFSAGAMSLLMPKPATAGWILKGGSNPDLPPTPPPAPFEPADKPALSITVTWNGAGNPLDPTGVNDGAAGCLKITDSVGYSGLINSTYSSYANLYLLLAPVGDMTVYVVAGNVGFANIRMLYAGRSWAWVGVGDWTDFGEAEATPSGTPDLWDTVMRPAVSAGFFIDDPSHTSTICFENVAISPFSTDIAGLTRFQQGGSGGVGNIFKNRCGMISLNKMQVARGRSNGISSGTAYEFDSMLFDQIEAFDTEFYGCGANNDQHNIYIHCCRLFRCVRIFSHDSGGHAYKVDAGCCQVIDSTISGNLLNITGLSGVWGATNNTVNISYSTDGYVLGCMIQSTINNSAPYALQSVWRRESIWLSNVKIPSYFPRRPAYFESRFPTWKFGYAGDDKYSQNSVGIVATTVGLGISTISVKSIAGELTATPTRHLSDTTPHAVDVIVYQDDGTLLITTATITAHGLATATLVMDDATTSTVTQTKPVWLKYNDASIGGAQQWDYPVRTYENRYLNLAVDDPESYWGQIAPGGQLQFNQQKGSPWGYRSLYVEDCMFSMLSSTKSNATPLIAFRDMLLTVFSSTLQIVTCPMGNLPSTDGSYVTAPNAGSWGPLPQAHAGVLPVQLLGTNETGGTGLNGTSWPRPCLDIYCNLSFHSINVAASNRWANQVDTAQQGSSAAPYGIAVATDVRYLNSAGVLTQVTDGVRSSPMPASIQCNTTADSLATTFSISVGAYTGGTPTIGKRIHIQLINGKGIHPSTITNVLPGVIEFADALEYKVRSGYAVTIFTAAGAKPAGWLTPSNQPV